MVLKALFTFCSFEVPWATECPNSYNTDVSGWWIHFLHQFSPLLRLINCLLCGQIGQLINGGAFLGDAVYRVVRNIGSLMQQLALEN